MKHFALSTLPIVRLLFFVAVLSSQISGCTQPPPPTIDCAKNSDICEVVHSELGVNLEEAQIVFNDGGLLFDADVGGKRIETGHSCTFTASITQGDYKAKLLSSANVGFSGNLLTGPMLFTTSLPVELSANLDIKTREGVRVLGGCTSLGSDSFRSEGSLSTTANTALFMSLEPKLSNAGDGYKVIDVRPLVDLSASLESTEIDLDVSGASPLTGIYTALVGSSSSLLKGIEALLNGDSASGLFKNALVDIGVGLVLTDFSIDAPITELIADFYARATTRKINGELEEKGEEALLELRSDISEALDLNSLGRASYLIGPDLKLHPPLTPPTQQGGCAVRSLGSSIRKQIYRWAPVKGADRYEVLSYISNTSNNIEHAMSPDLKLSPPPVILPEIIKKHILPERDSFIDNKLSLPCSQLDGCRVTGYRIRSCNTEGCSAFTSVRFDASDLPVTLSVNDEACNQPLLTESSS